MKSLFTSSKKYVITNLEYVGNSTFYNDYVEYIKADWGDEVFDKVSAIWRMLCNAWRG